MSIMLLTSMSRWKLTTRPLLSFSIGTTSSTMDKTKGGLPLPFAPTLIQTRNKRP